MLLVVVVNIIYLQGEGTRKLKDYLALPPTEYSLLDPKMITRLSEETFRCGGIMVVPPGWVS